ncbi:hypothetical protein Rt10032_c07g3045 [Rhodotorula toruloides]|uniref:Uncharacterized protein n=1 Tax=Rhodotorula toruloides TaxID=5286 RepID=A0A511KF76_RHOTO|nr:hypothetical protein Rt10032_c07g3045 [Rhodotorula toruloides]
MLPLSRLALCPCRPTRPPAVRSWVPLVLSPPSPLALASFRPFATTTCCAKAPPTLEERQARKARKNAHREWIARNPDRPEPRLASSSVARLKTLDQIREERAEKKARKKAEKLEKAAKLLERRHKALLPFQARNSDSHQLATTVKRLFLSPAGGGTAAGPTAGLGEALNLIRSHGDKANVVVWNTFLHLILNPLLVDAKKSRSAQVPGSLGHAYAVKKAYEVWMEMKRRGITPNVRSYQTFLTGAAKRARFIAEAVKEMGDNKDRSNTLSRVTDGWNAELRAKVETVHKQWLTHCERVRTKAAEQAEGGPFGTGEDEMALEGEDDYRREERGRRGRATKAGERDGRVEKPEDLSPVPTTQYLGFLAHTLASVAAPTSTGSRAAGGPAILSALLRTFESMPDVDHKDRELVRLAKTGVTYGVVFGALKDAVHAVVPASKRASAEVEDAEGVTASRRESAEVSDGLDFGESESHYPSVAALLKTATTYWDNLVAHRPLAVAPLFAARIPPARSSDYNLDPIVATRFLSIFTVPPPSLVPFPLVARALDVAQTAFGFVPPTNLADLEYPHPPSLKAPLATPLDGQGFAVALNVARRAGKESWVKAWWEMVAHYPERFGIKHRPDVDLFIRRRDQAEVVMRACATQRDSYGIEEMMEHLTEHSLHNTHKPLVSTYDVALSSLHRIGSIESANAAFRLWWDMVRTDPPLVAAQTPRRRGEDNEPGHAVHLSYARSAEAVIRAALATRDKSFVWRAVKAVAFPSAPGDPQAFEEGDGKGVSFDALSPKNFPPATTDGDGKRVEFKQNFVSLASAYVAALGRLVPSGSSERKGERGDAVLPPKLVGELKEWHEELKAWMRQQGADDRGDVVGDMAERRARRAERERERVVEQQQVREEPKEEREEEDDEEGGARGEGETSYRKARREKWWVERQEKEAELELLGLKPTERRGRGGPPEGGERPYRSWRDRDERKRRGFGDGPKQDRLTGRRHLKPRYG